eukprot:537667-Rhodomonas_salina.1
MCGSNSLVGAGCSVGTRTLIGSASQVQAGAQIESHSFVVGNSLGRQSNISRSKLSGGGLPRPLPGLTELFVWSVHVGWTALSLWVAIYAVWGLAEATPLPAAVLFPVGGGLFKLMQLLLFMLFQWIVARYRPGKRKSGPTGQELSRWDSWRFFVQMQSHFAFDETLLGTCYFGGPLAILNAVGAKVHSTAFIG